MEILTAAVIMTLGSCHHNGMQISVLCCFHEADASDHEMLLPLSSDDCMWDSMASLRSNLPSCCEVHFKDCCGLIIMDGTIAASGRNTTPACEHSQ